MNWWVDPGVGSGGFLLSWTSVRLSTLSGQRTSDISPNNTLSSIVEISPSRDSNFKYISFLIPPWRDDFFDDTLEQFFWIKFDVPGSRDSQILLLGIYSIDLGVILHSTCLSENHQPEITYIPLVLVAK